MKLIIAASTAFIAAIAVIFFYAPLEATQGVVQKIFYIHVASAFTMYTGFFLSFLFSIFFLFQKKIRLFWVSQSCLEVGYVFCCIVLATGPIWAKPIWGTFWTWEPRLTTTFITWLMYSAYLLLYSFFRETRRRGFGILSVLSILSFVNVPLIHFSVQLWRGIHPSVLRNKEGLPPSMQFTLVFTLIALLLVFFAVARLRLSIHQLERAIERIREDQHG